MSSVKITVAIVLAFVGCSANVVFLEHLIKFAPGCGDIVSFAQFIFISCYGFIKTTRFGTKRSVVPIRQYVRAVLLYFGTSVSGNLALGCNISMPLQMIFKSGSVLASLILGVVILNKSYPVSKYVSVVLISIGIAMCLLTSTENQQPMAYENSERDYLIWVFGIFLLLSSLFLGSTLGIVQETISVRYGKHPEELLFYTHALALPGFFFFGSSILQQSRKFSNSEIYQIPYLSLELPLVWLYLVLNVLTQFVCIRSVYTLATEVSALSLTVILTLRKFLSLVISIFYFNNPFTIYHWCGTVLVFSGTLLFSGVMHSMLDCVSSSTKTEKEKHD